MIDLIPDPESDRSVLTLLTAYRDSAHEAFPPPPADLIVARGRRRSRGRLVALSAAAAVAAATIGLTVVIGPDTGPDPDPGRSHSPSPTTSASPAPSGSPSALKDPSASTGPAGAQPGHEAGQPARERRPPGQVPAAAPLTLDDLGSGYRVGPQTAEGDWRFSYQLQVVCAGQVGRKLSPAPVASASSRVVSFARQGGGPSLVESVDGYLDNGAQQAAAHHRNAFATCAQFQTASGQYTFEVLDTGFAGENSMLVRSTYTSSASGGEVTRALHGFVWVGDLGAEIAFPDTTNVAWAQSITQRAAARLGAD